MVLKFTMHPDIYLWLDTYTDNYECDVQFETNGVLVYATTET